jgi:hypothetical protein
MATAGVLWIVGIGLIILGGCSGVALFVRAVGGSDLKDGEKATGTLWGLFIVGVLGGLILLAAVSK